MGFSAYFANVIMNQYHIVLCTIDCFRYDRCGFNGFEGQTTLFLDSLADEGYIFDSAYATGPYIPESVPGFLAGLVAKSAQYSGNLICKAIGHDDPTLPLHLRDQGYWTLATITNTLLSATRNFDRGFDEFTNLRLQESQPMEERKEADGEELDSSGAIRQRFRTVAEEYRIRPEEVPELEVDVETQAREHLEELGYI